ncbi:hypothetical protein CIHG_06733 [Coccidioides immitis H538.4]|uniref:Uncharacterized protein n=1 Tax=Coccidioides immitis H538.4 TaxID=396776 RepID=A0A0J8RVW3_COCIT|nr:hypothetical protein CIHG_06733 [Coccidioides immitis H538.4]
MIDPVSNTNQPGGWGDIPESRGYGWGVPSRGRGRGLPPMRPRGGGLRRVPVPNTCYTFLG